MEYIKLDKNRYLVKNSNGIIVSKKEMKDENNIVKEAKQIKRTNSRKKRTRN